MKSKYLMICSLIALLSGLNFSVSMAAVNQTAKIMFAFNEGMDGQHAVFDSDGI